MNKPQTPRLNLTRLFFTLILLQFLSACTTAALVGASTGAAIGVAGATMKTTGAIAGAVIPGGDSDKEEKDN